MVARTAYFTGGPPRQAVAQGQSNPQGPQPASVTLKAARTTMTATHRAIHEIPSTRQSIQES